MLWMYNSEETLFYKMNSYIYIIDLFFLELGRLYWVKYCIWNNVYI